MTYGASLARTSSQGDGGVQITIGIVVDVDDPQQNGRIRVACHSLGDEVSPNRINLQNIPWATMAPFLAGSMVQGYRGVMGVVDSEVPYGFFGVPKVGTEVIIALVDGDPNFRVCLGCLHHNGASGAAPHGRYTSTGEYPKEPLSMADRPIQPLSTNLQLSFSGPFNQDRNNYEWFSRATDYTFSAHRGTNKNPRQASDDPEDVEIVEGDGNTINYTQGYAKDRIGEQSDVVTNANRKYDPQTYALVSPGFHAVSLDDRADNCRIRLRTTSGHQIIMDDTNERIYISTMKGKNWVEMDSCGNVDIHSDTRVSIHAAKDINLTSEETIRLSSKNIHMRAQNELRMFSNGDTHIFSNANIRTRAKQSHFSETGAKFEIMASSDVLITSSANVHMMASSSLYLTGNGSVELLSSGNIIHTASKVLSNAGTSATSASSATQSQAKTAFHSNRIPMHEPWPRVMTDKQYTDVDNQESPIPIIYTGNSMEGFEFKSYDSPQIGRVDYGVSLGRNPKWHR